MNCTFFKRSHRVINGHGGGTKESRCKAWKNRNCTRGDKTLTFPHGKGKNMVKIFSSEENWICLLSETKRESICHEFATELTFLEISPVVMMNREIKYG